MCVHPDTKLRVFGVYRSRGAMIPLVCIAQRRPRHWNVISGEDALLTYLLSTWQPGQAKNLASRVILQLSEFVLQCSVSFQVT